MQTFLFAQFYRLVVHTPAENSSMGEVLGPIGFCFGGISFVLSTIPNAAKTLHDFEECRDQFRGYKTRLAICEARIIRRTKQRSEHGEREEIGYLAAVDEGEVKDIIEGWITTLEKAIDCIEKLSEREFEQRTAAHSGSGPSLDPILELEELEDFASRRTHCNIQIKMLVVVRRLGNGEPEFDRDFSDVLPMLDIDGWRTKS
ncbi:uncharacterized protein BDR25DRAFT_318175 [Lindgomyces ingoldianus]|uniref:Uncharacterized protein n=1 Tax=Lindgomyces ingoldianus TaxID=673940 RepID=A0ACB6QFN0_9PLEO|nr:uncharacterized protein BDR25DRAFT_318175 [Lindgomyces ingoldianus]KAF2465701.1 hypothetical protein BDR25DRAFT_318175 [Lindgomyces ingoldianus]